MADDWGSFLRHILFRQEWLRAHSELNLLTEYQRLPARLGISIIHVTGKGKDLRSIKVAEAAQQSTFDLPCGARTLFLDAQTGRLIFRGINKFPNLAQFTFSGNHSFFSQIPADFRIYLQKKVAGFISYIFADDEGMIRFASKHMLEGEHVALAQNIFFSTWKYAGCPNHLARLAAQLQQREIALCCETVDTENDNCHPVLETTAAQDFVVFGAIKYRSLPELTLPVSEVKDFCEQFHLNFSPIFDVAPHATPFCDGTNSTQVSILRNLAESIATAWRDLPECNQPEWLRPLPPEGYVLLIEMPLLHKGILNCHLQAMFPSLINPLKKSEENVVVPLRFKLKTAQYVMVRALRSALANRLQQ